MNNRSDKLDLSSCQTLFQLAEEVAHIGYWMWDIATNQVVWSKTKIQIYGEDAETFQPSFEAFINAVDDQTRRRIEMEIEAVLAGRKPFYDLKHQIRLRDGRTAWIHEKGFVVRDDDGKPVRMEGIVYDITEIHRLLEALRQENAKLHYLEVFDPLTGLPNREALRRTLRQLSEGGRAFGLIMLDIEGFGKINTTCGYECGDAVLTQVAERLRQHFPEQVFHHSVDEFAIITPQPPTEHICQQIHRLFHDALEANGRSFHLGIALGCSRFPDDAATPKELIRTAQAALRYAKQGEGRNKSRFYQPAMRANLAQEQTLLEALKADLAKQPQRFQLHYQPQVDCRDGRLVGVEALVRWMGPDGELLAPGRFLPIAQQAGLMSELDTISTEQAFRQLSQWHSDGHQLRLSLNLNLADLHHPPLLLLMEKHRALMPHVTLELTEEALMRCTEEELAAIERLKGLGARLAIDDFGTGYASLRYLHQLPVDTLKIDRSFVQNLPDDRRDQDLITIIQSIIDTFGFDAVVEGVETQAQRDYFCQRGLHCIQGFLYSPPLPAETLARRFLNR